MLKLTRRSSILALVALLSTTGHFAQANQAAKDAQEPQIKPTITQQRSYPDGSVGEVHLIQEKVEWSEALHGYLIVVRAKAEEPALISLDDAGVKPSDVSVRTVQDAKKFTTSDFQTDIKLTQVIGKTDAGQMILEYSGKLTVCMIPPSNASGGEAKLFPLAGRPGTRLDLSALFDRKQQITFLGQSWRPTTDNQAIMVVGKNVIELMNVKAIDNN